MKNLFLILFFFIAFFSCESDNSRFYNPYLENVQAPVNFQINLNLPAFTPLQYVGNAVFIDGYGINGVMVINTGNGFLAFEATCANHTVESCSRLALDGVEAKCSCDHELTYNLFTGQPSSAAQYTLLQYRVYDNGNNILNVTN